MKRGGIGYIQPTADTFPVIDEFYQVIFDCTRPPGIYSLKENLEWLANRPAKKWS